MFSIFKKEKKCEICTTGGARDILIVPEVNGKATSIRLCRNDFFQEHKKAFLAHPYKMVVTYPILENKHSVYGYYDLSEMKKYAYDKDDINIIKRTLEAIPQDKECAYFDRLASEKAFGKGQGQRPSLLPESQAQFLTREKAYSKISEAFSVRQGDFDDGFTVPYGKEGACLSSLL